jgi:hypothetical protein
MEELRTMELRRKPSGSGIRRSFHYLPLQIRVDVVLATFQSHGSAENVRRNDASCLYN